MSDGRCEEAMAVGLEGGEDADRAGLGAAQGAYCALNGAEAAFELGRWDVVERVTGGVLAERASDAVVRTARLQQAILGAVRGEFAAAHEGLRGVRDLGPASTPELGAYTLELEAELAIWEGRPEAASYAAAEACEPAARADITARCAAVGIRAEADRAERARAKRDSAAAQAASERARGFRDLAAAGAGPLLLTVEAELARAEGRVDPAGVGGSGGRVEREGGALPGRLRALAVGGGAAGRAAATAATQPTSCAPRGRWPSASARGPCATRSTPSHGAPASTWRPPARPQRRCARSCPTRPASSGLTPRELEVLEHVAMGQTNREIAAELFISARTAGVHVSHILEKLGASTRTEAAAAAHRLGLAP